MLERLRRHWAWVAALLAVYVILALPQGTKVITGQHESWWLHAVVTNKTFFFYTVLLLGVTASFKAGEVARSRWYTAIGLVGMAAFALLWNVTYSLPVAK